MNKRLLLSLFAMAICLHVAQSIEVSPSEKKVPEKFIHRPGKRYSIFAGDPTRVQKVMEVRIHDLQSKVVLAKKEISLQEMKMSEGTLETTFAVFNRGKRNYILSFPDAQRFDIMIKDEKDKVIYAWSDDKIFVKEAGQSFLHKQEMIAFKPDPAINFTPILETLKPGKYKIVGVLSNYPEVQSSETLTVVP